MSCFYRAPDFAGAYPGITLVQRLPTRRHLPPESLPTHWKFFNLIAHTASFSTRKEADAGCRDFHCTDHRGLRSIRCPVSVTSALLVLRTLQGRRRQVTSAWPSPRGVYLTTAEDLDEGSGLYRAAVPARRHRHALRADYFQVHFKETRTKGRPPCNLAGELRRTPRRQGVSLQQY